MKELEMNLVGEKAQWARPGTKDPHHCRPLVPCGFVSLRVLVFLNVTSFSLPPSFSVRFSLFLPFLQTDVEL